MSYRKRRKTLKISRGDLIQYNLHTWANAPNDEDAYWVIGLVLGPHDRGVHIMRVLWFDDWEETQESNPQCDEGYRMFSPGSSAG